MEVKTMEELLASNGGERSSLTELSLAKRGIAQLCELGDCEKLARVDLSGNLLENVEALSTLKELKWLSTAGNKLTSIKGLEKLKKLTVLNCSRNQLTSIEEVQKLKELKALIVNENQISSICSLHRLAHLNTLVLSHNPLRKLGDSVSKLPMLTKLSLSHCELKTLGNSLANCLTLEELRLAHNQLKVLPKELELNSQLRIIDVGSNKLNAWKDVEVLSRLSRLSNLNVRGNPLCDEPGYNELVKRELPKLHVFDGRAMQGSKASTRKRKATPEVPQDSSTVKSSEDSKGVDNDEEKPFLELVTSSEKDAPLNVKNKNNSIIKGGSLRKDSKVVSITEERGRKNRRKRLKDGAPDSVSSIANALNRDEIGVGGPSAWES